MVITGGAGFIGVHVVRATREAGEPVAVHDDLSTGGRSRVPADVPFVQGSTLDAAQLRRSLTDLSVHGVVRLAAKKQVARSEAPMVPVIGEVTGHSAVATPVSARAGPVPLPVVAAADRIRGELAWHAQHDERAKVASVWAGWCLRMPQARR
ncbi:NAD-dependent epimerase/dehydratase family protein [Streptomyces sp. NPDC005318]|uniref:NAD-dependent epimerase/dehydratase family protein n=1 Tax=Streptomyces sp. NPDC005318 TaxID=3157031 RepID=UPI0033B02407